MVDADESSQGRLSDVEPSSSSTSAPSAATTERPTLASLQSFLESSPNPEWKLSHDADLVCVLGDLSRKFQVAAKATSQRLMDLEDEVDKCKVEIRTTITSLMMLSSGQFVENRVYDEADTQEADAEESKAEALPSSKYTEGKTHVAVMDEAVKKGMRALNLAYIEQEDNPEDCCYYYECSDGDVFNSRPLPYVVGSEEFNNSRTAGLGDEDEASGGTDYVARDSYQSSGAGTQDARSFSSNDAMRGDRGFSVDDDDYDEEEEDDEIDDDDDDDDDDAGDEDESTYSERQSFRPSGARPTSLSAASELSQDFSEYSDDDNGNDGSTNGAPNAGQGSVSDIRAAIASQMNRHNRARRRTSSGNSESSDGRNRSGTDDSWASKPTLSEKKAKRGGESSTKSKRDSSSKSATGSKREKNRQENNNGDSGGEIIADDNVDM